MAAAHPAYKRFLVILVLGMGIGMGLVACGGDEDPPSAAEDKARAEKVVLTDADVPGLTKDPADDDTDTETDPSDEAFEKCLDNNVLLTDLGEDERGAEASFSDEDEEVTRSSVVTFAETKKEAEEAFDAVSKDSFAGCLEDAFKTGLQEEIGSDATVGDVAVSKLPDEDLGDEHVAYRAAVDLSAAGQSFELSFDFVFVRVDRGLAGLFAFDVEEAFAAGERTRLTKILADRLEDA